MIMEHAVYLVNLVQWCMNLNVSHVYYIQTSFPVQRYTVSSKKHMHGHLKQTSSYDQLTHIGVTLKIIARIYRLIY